MVVILGWGIVITIKIEVALSSLHSKSGEGGSPCCFSAFL